MSGASSTNSSIRRSSLAITPPYVDLINSIELANYWSPKRYNDFLNEFQERMITGVDFWGGQVTDLKIAADELVVLFASGDVRKDISNAITLATNLKILWYVK